MKGRKKHENPRPSKDEISQFYRNVLRLAESGDTLSIEVLVLASCKAYERTSSDFTKPPSALDLIYDDRHHSVFVRNSKVVLKVLEEIEKRYREQKADAELFFPELLQCLINFYDEILSSCETTTNTNVVKTLENIKNALATINKRLDALRPKDNSSDGNNKKWPGRSEEHEQLKAFYTLYSDFESLSAQVTSGKKIEIRVTEAHKETLPHGHRGLIDLLLEVKGKDALNILTGEARSSVSKVTSRIERLPVPIERKVAELLFCQLWLLEPSCAISERTHL